MANSIFDKFGTLSASSLKDAFNALAKYAEKIESFSTEEKVKKELVELGKKYHITNDSDSRFWKLISENDKLSDDFLCYNCKYIDWRLACQHQSLSEYVIRKNIQFIDWVAISMHQTLSENFINEYKDKVNWDSISLTQRFGIKFAIENAKLLHPNIVKLNNNIPKEELVEILNILKLYHSLENEE
jgi:hypothetical protein